MRRGRDDVGAGDEEPIGHRELDTVRRCRRGPRRAGGVGVLRQGSGREVGAPDLDTVDGFRSRINELRQHRDYPFEQFDAACVVAVLDDLIDSHDVEMRG